jgi:hypothetical protein
MLNPSHLFRESRETLAFGRERHAWPRYFHIEFAHPPQSTLFNSALSSAAFNLRSTSHHHKKCEALAEPFVARVRTLSQISLGGSAGLAISR